MDNTQSQILVVGGTVAGMAAAIAAADKGAHVTIISRTPLVRSADVAIKDGIAAVLHNSLGDSVEQHVRDTLSASNGRTNENFVRQVCERAPTLVRFLARAGVLFNRTPEGNVDQVNAPGHANPRTVRVDDATGQHVVRVLEEQVRRCESAGSIDRNEYLVPLSLVFDEENRCRGVVIMQRYNHTCAALKADAVIVTDTTSSCLYGEARQTGSGLVTGDDHMTTLAGFFAAGSCTDECMGVSALSDNILAANLVSGAGAGESACSYVSGLTTHADELGESLFERACDREEKYNKGLLDRSEGENPYVLADEFKVWREKWVAGERDEEALESIASRLEKAQLPDSSQWWNDSLIFTRDLMNQIAQARAIMTNSSPPL